MIKKLLIAKEKQFQKQGHLSFTDSELDSLSEADADRVINHFHGTTLMMLPPFEITFFDWLKIEDEAVWNDLWQDEENPYYVSIDLLRNFIHDANGFPICDLIKVPNYWFSVKHIKPQGKELFPEIEKKLENNAKLNFEEALLVEVMQGSIDLWHFCFKYNFPIKKAKNIVRIMHRDDLLVHLPEREDLVKYLDI